MRHGRDALNTLLVPRFLLVRVSSIAALLGLVLRKVVQSGDDGISGHVRPGPASGTWADRTGCLVFAARAPSPSD